MAGRLRPMFSESPGRHGRGRGLMASEGIWGRSCIGRAWSHLGISGNMLCTVSTCSTSDLNTGMRVRSRTISGVTFFGLKPSTVDGDGVPPDSLFPARSSYVSEHASAERVGEHTTRQPSHNWKVRRTYRTKPSARRAQSQQQQPEH